MEMKPLCSFALYLTSSFLVILVHQPQLRVALAQTNLTAGSTLAPPNYMTSRSGDFAFGFRALDSNATQFILAIWFHFKTADPAEQKVVWFAKDASSGATVTATKQSVLNITVAGQLSLANPANESAPWSPSQNPGSVLVLRDTGNLQFLADGSSGAVVWESFQHPTDTLLPGQSMGGGKSLLCRRADMDFSLGRFGLYVQLDGNIVLYMTDHPARESSDAYWAAGTNQQGNTPDGNTTVFFDSPGHLYCQQKSGATKNLTSNPPNSTDTYYQHATLDPDGIIRVYVRPKITAGRGSNTTFWAVTGQFPIDGCRARTDKLEGMCGPNTYCVYSDERLDCECPTGYSYLDKQYKPMGCKPDFGKKILCGGAALRTSCGTACTVAACPISSAEQDEPAPSSALSRQETETHMKNNHELTAEEDAGSSRSAEEIGHTAAVQAVPHEVRSAAPPHRIFFPDFAPDNCDRRIRSAEFEVVELSNTTWETSARYKTYKSTTAEQCRDYCLSDCFCIAAMFDGSNCDELSELSTGWQTNITTNKALIKVRTTSPPANTKSAGTLLSDVVIGCLALSLLVTTSILLVHCYYTKKDANQRLSTMRVFTRKELFQATNGFKNLLGKGGFGEVYLGKVKSVYPTAVAVKKLINSNEQGDREFTNEVQSIGQIHHKNLVRMIGYCKEGKHRMLVFEFMPSGSLRNFLFQPERPPWSWRSDAALGIARGLEYLHEGCISPIIHCDIKPDNILLDDNHSPKITDFGIAKLLGNHQVQTTVTNVRGTRGYIAPEWFRLDGHIDTKADVYSFGVVLLEMICCRKCQEPLPNDDEAEETVTLFGWAGQQVSSGKFELLLQRDDDAMEDLERVERFTRVALSCIEPNPSLRPTMHQVVQMLEGVFGADSIPTTPSRFVDPTALNSFVNISNSASSIVKVASDDQGDGQ